VFRLLTAPDVEASAALSSTWREQIAGLPAPRQASAELLLLGDGGLYLEREVAPRAELFACIESAVQGVARDVEPLVARWCGRSRRRWRCGDVDAGSGPPRCPNPGEPMVRWKCQTTSAVPFSSGSS
jgi:hypothetical protein